jgi:hypothetical protein
MRATYGPGRIVSEYMHMLLLRISASNIGALVLEL